jgi:hypothetical protein
LTLRSTAMRRINLLVGIAVVLGLFVGIGALREIHIRASFGAGRQKPVSHDSLAQVRATPIHLARNVRSSRIEWTRNDFGAIVSSLDPSRGDVSKLSASNCLHLLAALGLEARFADKRLANGNALLSLLTDSEQATEYFGNPVLLRTPYGVRPVSDSHFKLAAQAHRDQLLCCLAQLGIPLGHPIIVERHRCTFGEVLGDSIANFHLRQEELEFTAIAYALYLPPHRAWTNKFGETYCFDDLVSELLQRGLYESHCYGAHLIEAMAVIDGVDRDIQPVLSEASRQQLRNRLAIVVAEVLRCQARDGSWGPLWSYGIPSPARPQGWTPRDDDWEERLLVTAHITQFLASLPAKHFTIEDPVFARAITWLDEATAHVDQRFIAENYCPCSHAAWCLNECRRDAPPSNAATGLASFARVSDFQAISSRSGRRQ